VIDQEDGIEKLTLTAVIHPRDFARLWLFISLVLLGSAALARVVVAPAMLDLASEYANETFYNANSRFRATPAGAWQDLQLVVRRMDQTLVNNGAVAVIQSDLHWITEKGQLLFENSGLYGVDRRTRKNVPAQGDQIREGYFLFPPHIQRTAYSYWDSMFIGLRSASYDHSEDLGGLETYVFRFGVSGLDETAGYSYLADVPAHYAAHIDGQGKMWIEPLSGIVVDYEEQGTSYFVATETGMRVANFFEWSDRYTPETKAAQLRQARLARLRIQVFERWLPGGIFLLGSLLLALYLNRMIDSKRRPA
jgi:Porin PorA